MEGYGRRRGEAPAAAVPLLAVLPLLLCFSFSSLIGGSRKGRVPQGL